MHYFNLEPSARGGGGGEGGGTEWRERFNAANGRRPKSSTWHNYMNPLDARSRLK